MPTTTTDAPTIRKRLAELRAEHAKCSTRQEALLARVRYGRSDEDKQAAIAALIAGQSPEPEDVQDAFRQNTARLKDLGAAIATLEEEEGREEVRRGFQEATPLFEAAKLHVTRLAKAYAEVERATREAQAALTAFELIHPDRVGMTAPYDRYDLVPLHAWCTQDFIGDGYNKSRLEVWREEARERGYKV
jgi:phosphoenolpyruvate synthase/pyruvate phosphate dikinase